jgi:hypothetical protein
VSVRGGHGKWPLAGLTLDERIDSEIGEELLLAQFFFDGLDVDRLVVNDVLDRFFGRSARFDWRCHCINSRLNLLGF